MSASNRRKPGCLSTFFSFIVISVAVLYFMYSVSTSGNDDSPAATAAPTQTVAQSATVAPAATAAPAGAPGINGSNAYDVVASLKDMGYKLDRQDASAGYYWSFSDTADGVFVTMDITANKDYEICSASFTMTGGDNGFLYFGSTLPYSAADKSQTEALIKSDTEKSITIGDAVWTIRPLENGKWLHVCDIDYDAWCIVQITAASN